MVVKWLLPGWLKYRLSILSVQTVNAEILIDLYQQFQAGNTRFLLAFRHPSTADPFTMAYLLWYAVPRAARQRGIVFKAPVRSYFMYDRGIPLWAGNFVTWLFPRLGGTPILRGKADRTGLRAARDLFANGQYPLSVAPEGGTNEHNELLSPLEPGVAQFGFWCVEDLHKAGRQESVYIVPIGMKYTYVNPPWEKLAALLSELETATGLVTSAPLPLGLLADAQADNLYGRLLRLSNRILDLMEGFYTRYYHRTLPDPTQMTIVSDQPLPKDGPNQQLTARLQALLEVALQVPEEYFGLQANGNFSDRCRKLEQAAWDRIHRQDIDQLSPLECGLADWLAAEADLQMRHMRIVERLATITGNYIIETPTANRFADVILILWKTVFFLQGGDPNQAPKLGPRSVQLTVGTPLSVSDRWSLYQANRRGARQAITELTHALQTALKELMVY
jgi:1-acyl-sn-glycerol-3-phosphate acyltransferase